MIKTPQIVGTRQVNIGESDVQFKLGNLDTKAVSITPTFNSIGILSLHSFINNGDGTGEFKVDFDPNIYLYQVQIEIETSSGLIKTSNVHILAIFEELVQFDNLKIEPISKYYQQIYDDLLEGMPKGNSYCINHNYTIPYSVHPSLWKITVPYLGRLLKVYVNDEFVKEFIPESPKFILPLNLEKGLSSIKLEYDGESTFTTVGRGTFASLLELYAHEIYKSTYQLDLMDLNYFNIFTSNILQIEKYLPPWKQLKYFSKQKTLEGIQESDVKKVFSGYTSNNSFIEKITIKDLFKNTYTNREHLAGYNFHYWSFDSNITRMLSFAKFLKNNNLSEVQHLRGRYEVWMNYEYSDFYPPVGHIFDKFKELPLLDLISEIYETDEDKLYWFPQITWDSAFSIEHPLGSRVSFDASIPLDLGYELDTSELDPGADGWVGWSPYGRWDGEYDSDTSIMPQTLPHTARLESITAGKFDLYGKELNLQILKDGVIIDTPTWNFGGSGDLWEAEDVVEFINPTEYLAVHSDITNRVYFEIVYGNYDIKVLPGSANLVFGWEDGQIATSFHRANLKTVSSEDFSVTGKTFIINVFNSMGGLVATDTCTFSGIDPLSISSIVTQLNGSFTTTYVYYDFNNIIHFVSLVGDYKLEIDTGTANTEFGFSGGESSEGSYISEIDKIVFRPATLSSMNLDLPSLKLTL